MDIAALSILLSQEEVSQQAGISVMNKVLDTGEAQMMDMINMLRQNTMMMERSVHPHIGNNIDLSI
ncbi:MAG: hypothetical protein K0S76_46 [Herbinix sp.]|nr:hypothetical protein [Herbinix sp.]